jgi:diadenosine tetraphosphate (Ap4A) HIT family hydrolase
MFVLHERLAADTTAIADWELCTVLLMNDANFTWLVLVPKRQGLRDFHDLERADWTQAMTEIDRASRALQAVTSADKINVGALGNMVPQLHIHVIARHQGDTAWPGAVWGAQPAQAYDAVGLEKVSETLRSAFASGST